MTVKRTLILAIFASLFVSQAILLILGIFFLVNGIYLSTYFFTKINPYYTVQMSNEYVNMIISFFKNSAMCMFGFSIITAYVISSYEKTRVVQNIVIAYIKSTIHAKRANTSVENR